VSDDLTPLDDGVGGALTNLARVEAAYFASRRAIVRAEDFLAHLEADWSGERPTARARALLAFYPRFIELLCGCPEVDQDSLFRAGSRVFGVRIGVMRRDLARAMQVKSST